MKVFNMRMSKCRIVNVNPPAPPSGLYLDFEQPDGSDGLSAFDEIKVTTSGNDGSSYVERSDSWASHGSYGIKHKTSGDSINIACIKNNGTDGSSDFDIYAHFRHQTGQTSQAAIFWGSYWDLGPDFTSGVLLFNSFAGGKDYLELSQWTADGLMQDYAEVDYEEITGGLADGGVYKLHLNITISGDTVTVTGEIYDSTDTLMETVSGVYTKDANWTDNVGLGSYSTASVDADTLIMDELEVVVND